MNAAVLVPTPAMGGADGGTSSTYTPGDRYWATSPSFPLRALVRLCQLHVVVAPLGRRDRDRDLLRLRRLRHPQLVRPRGHRPEDETSVRVGGRGDPQTGDRDLGALDRRVRRIGDGPADADRGRPRVRDLRQLSGG